MDCVTIYSLVILSKDSSTFSANNAHRYTHYKQGHMNHYSSGFLGYIL